MRYDYTTRLAALRTIYKRFLRLYGPVEGPKHYEALTSLQREGLIDRQVMRQRNA